MAPMNPGIDFSNVSDDDISQMLKDYGVVVGPVNVATRNTYERKLIKLKTGCESPSSTHYEPVDDDEEDNEFQFRKPEWVSSPKQAEARHMPSQIPKPAQPRFRGEVSDYSVTARVDSRPGLTHSRRTLSSDGPTDNKKSVIVDQEKSSSLPLWVKLVALLTVFLLVYLIYCNMEPQAISNIPNIQNKIEV